MKVARTVLNGERGGNPSNLHNITLRIMENRRLNRIKVVLVDKQKSNKWLAEQVGKDPATISKWVTNTTQPNLEMLLQIAKVLEVNVNDLVRPLE